MWLTCKPGQRVPKATAALSCRTDWKLGHRAFSHSRVALGRYGRGGQTCCAVSVNTADAALWTWLIESKDLPRQLAAPSTAEHALGVRTTFVATSDIQEGQTVLSIPGDVAISKQDALSHDVIAPLADGRDDLVCLALWVMAERGKAQQSQWKPLLDTFPESSGSPIFWTAEERQRLLKGSPTLAEANVRRAALDKEWDDIASCLDGADMAARGDAANFTRDAFLSAFSVVLANAVYLPSARCFALVPAIGAVKRTGNNNGCDVDFDFGNNCVRVVATRPYRQGQEIALNDGRPNGELLLATGVVDDNNTSDFVPYKTSLVQIDRLYTQKKSILEAYGFSDQQEFPLYEDRFPVQLLTYLRLARLSDPAQFAKINFDSDIVVSQENEYEVLQLMMGDLREALSGYDGDREDDLKALQQPASLSRNEYYAAKLRLCERTILLSSIDSVRRRLAPIRGIPTKSGKLVDPNADLREIFEIIEDIPNAPKKAVDGFLSWWRGDHDKNQPPR